MVNSGLLPAINHEDSSCPSNALHVATTSSSRIQRITLAFSAGDVDIVSYAVGA